MRGGKAREDIASEPYAAREDDASGKDCSMQQIFKRNFVLQKLVALQVRSYLSSNAELTHEKALSIFRDMRWKSNVKAFLLHPVTLLSIGVVGTFPFLCITATGILDIAIRILFIVGGCALGFIYDQFTISRPWEMAYLDQSKKLSEYITTLEENPTMSVELASLKPEPPKGSILTSWMSS